MGTGRGSRSRSTDLAVAHHEAGHAVAARRERIRIRGLSIEPAEAFAGAIRIQDPLRGVDLDIEYSDRARLRMERAVRVCLAGGVAQREHSRRSYRTAHDADDRNKASGYIVRVTGSDEEYKTYSHLLGLQTEYLVKWWWWQDITKVAHALIMERVLSPQRIKEILDS